MESYYLRSSRSVSDHLIEIFPLYSRVLYGVFQPLATFVFDLLRGLRCTTLLPLRFAASSG